MNTGDTVTDSQGRIWTAGQELGRGLWGRTFVVRDESATERVLKVALRASDLPADIGAPERLLDSIDKTVTALAAQARDSRHPFLPRLDDVLTLPNGARGLLMPRYPSSLATRIRAGAPLAEVLAIVIDVGKALHAAGLTHGNLRPSNILLTERGEPILTDQLPRAMVESHKTLATLCRDRLDYLPPEAQSAPKPVWDTWALCMVLYHCIERPPDDRHGRPVAVQLPHSGLGKVELASLRDKALARLTAEGANERFAHRVGEKLGAVLNRGISQEPAPSPPFRFDGHSALLPRLGQIAELVDPQVESVGQLLLSADARGEVFGGSALAAFSVTVGCSAGCTHEDLATGVQVVDLDAEGDGRVPVPDAQYAVKAHPSGRIRFDFSLPDLQPGRYRVRVAFTVKGSGAPPAASEGRFEVRPPPGYIPPVEAEMPPSGPITFPGERRPTDAGMPSSVDDDASYASVADLFPSPIAPSSVEPTSPGERTLPEPVVASPAPSVVPAASPAPAEVAGLRVVPTAPEAPSAAGIAPVMPAPAPQLQAVPTPPPTAEPVIAKSSPPPAPTPWSGPGQWEQLPGPEVSPPLPTPAHSGLPSDLGPEELPTFGEADPGGDSPNALLKAVEPLVELLRNNTWLAFAAVLAVLATGLGGIALVLNLLAG